MHNILVFGDSIAAGKAIAPDKSWPSLLAINLNKGEDKRSPTVLNLSVPGNSTNEILARFPAEVQTRYKTKFKNDLFTIIFAVGINDAKAIGLSNKIRTPADDFKKNIKKLILLARSYTDQIIFVGLTPVNEEKAARASLDHFLNKYILRYNDIIRRVCVYNEVPFIEIINNWPLANYNRLLANDGIHPNEFGHKRIYKQVIDFINSKKNNHLNKFQIFKKEFHLSIQDVETIKSRFIESKFFKHPFSFGQFRDEKPELIIGAPCIRKDIEGLCLNTFSQIFIPIKVASILRLPCKLFIGVKEEIIFQPKLEQHYNKLGFRLEKLARNIAKKLGVEIEIVNTAYRKYDKTISNSVKDLGIRLSAEDSTHLFNLFFNRRKKRLHSHLRTQASERVVACNTSYTLNKLFGRHRNLIVEDVEQHACVLFAKKYEKECQPPNFLAFLPLPNISGTAAMFKSRKKERLLIGENDNYYRLIFKKIPPLVLKTYNELFDLVFPNKDSEKHGFKSFLNNIKKILILLTISRTIKKKPGQILR